MTEGSRCEEGLPGNRSFTRTSGRRDGQETRHPDVLVEGGPVFQRAPGRHQAPLSRRGVVENCAFLTAVCQGLCVHLSLMRDWDEGEKRHVYSAGRQHRRCFNDSGRSDPVNRPLCIFPGIADNCGMHATQRSHIEAPCSKLQGMHLFMEFTASGARSPWSCSSP